ncbi:MAG: alkaline phosphatase family protein [Saprospiraceae bacterium]
MKSPIEHIIVLMLENRSFDHLFGFLKHPKKINGLTGNEFNPVSATDATPKTVYKTSKTSISPDPPHSHEEVMLQMDLGIGGQNDGFVKAFSDKKNLKRGTSDIGEIMGAIDTESDKKCGFIMAELARRFVLCDNWHSSVPGETWPNRNFAIAGTSNGEVNIKTRFYKNRTIFEAVADHGLQWQIYHDGPPQTWAFYKLWFKGNGGFRSFSHFKKDVKDNNLANFVFIEPKHFALKGITNNMHPGNNSSESDTDFKNAENLVAFIYNTLNSHKKVFNKSLLLITFDEHGGFYDHVPPPRCVPPDDLKSDDGFAFDRLGVRVPAIIISPFAKKSYVDSTLYDHTSIIKSTFDNFQIPGHLTKRDKLANSFIRNALASRKKLNLDTIIEHPIDIYLTRSNKEEKLNEFQSELADLAFDVETVMDKDINKVEKNITNMGNLKSSSVTRSSTKTTASTDKLREIENNFHSMYNVN